MEPKKKEKGKKHSIDYVKEKEKLCTTRLHCIPKE
jgi:hypothetical protein